MKVNEDLYSALTSRGPRELPSRGQTREATSSLDESYLKWNHCDHPPPIICLPSAERDPSSHTGKPQGVKRRRSKGEANPQESREIEGSWEFWPQRMRSGKGGKGVFDWMINNLHPSQLHPTSSSFTLLHPLPVFHPFHFPLYKCSTLPSFHSSSVPLFH